MSTATIVGIALLVLGFVLIGVELHIPGFGVFGIAGIVSLCVGIIMVSKSVEQGVMIAIGCIVVIAVMATIVITNMNKKSSKSPIVLNEKLENGTAPIGEEDLQYLVGKEGVCVTDLRPLGIASFDGVELSVKSKGGKYLVHDQKIKVVGIVENKIIVELNEI